jgi:hypothetical protein
MLIPMAEILKRKLANRAQLGTFRLILQLYFLPPTPLTV